MSFKITGQYPKGYLAEEKIFCQKEENLLMRCKGCNVKDPDWIFARNSLFSKRAEFKKKWNKNH